MTRGIDTTSSTWAALKKRALERLETYRAEIDSEDTDERRTQNLRGRIAELTDLLALSESKPVVKTGGRVQA